MPRMVLLGRAGKSLEVSLERWWWEYPMVHIDCGRMDTAGRETL
jgi:hypothetical protein